MSQSQDEVAVKNILHAKSLVVDTKATETDDELYIDAIVSSPIPDRDGEIIDTGTIRHRSKVDGSVDVPILADHNYTIDSVLGNVVEEKLLDSGELQYKLRFANFKEKAVETFKLLKEGFLDNAFSIGYLYDPSKVEGNVIKEATIHEVSVVVLPANQRARLVTAVKSLQDLKNKEDQMADTDVRDDGADADEAKAKVEETAEVRSEIKEVEVTETVEAKAETVETVVEDNNKEEKEKKEMSDTTVDVAKIAEEAATKAAKAVREEIQAEATKAAKAETKEVPQVEVKSAEDQLPWQVRFMRQFKALENRDSQTLETLNKVATKAANALGTKDQYVFDGTNLSNDIICAEIDREIYKCTQEYGVIAGLVGRDTFSGAANSRKYLAKTGQMDFDLISNCNPKPVKETFNVTSQEAAVYEAAMVTLYCDTDAEDAAFSWVDEIISEVGDAVRRLENFIVLNWNGALDGGAADPARATGLLVNPGLENIDVSAADFPNGALDAACAAAVCARANMTLVMNYCTYAKILKEINSACNNCSDGPDYGRQYLSLWGYRVVLDEEIEDNKILAGDFSKFRLLTKGGLQISQSNQATVVLPDATQKNLWQDNLTGIKAYLRIGGFIRDINAFKTITCV